MWVYDTDLNLVNLARADRIRRSGVWVPPTDDELGHWSTTDETIWADFDGVDDDGTPRMQVQLFHGSCDDGDMYMQRMGARLNAHLHPPDGTPPADTRDWSH